jgi:hypothetical protein
VLLDGTFDAEVVLCLEQRGEERVATLGKPSNSAVIAGRSGMPPVLIVGESPLNIGSQWKAERASPVGSAFSSSFKVPERKASSISLNRWM